MKKQRICRLLFLGIMVFSFSHFSLSYLQAQALNPCVGRWWQREIPTPSNNQIINPDYVAKKRQLEIACDDYNDTLKAIEHYESLHQNTTALINSAISQENKIKDMEYELSQIPMYINP